LKLEYEYWRNFTRPTKCIA